MARIAGSGAKRAKQEAAAKAAGDAAVVQVNDYLTTAFRASGAKTFNKKGFMISDLSDLTDHEIFELAEDEKRAVAWIKERGDPFALVGYMESRIRGFYKYLREQRGVS